MMTSCGDVCTVLGSVSVFGSEADEFVCGCLVNKTVKFCWGRDISTAATSGQARRVCYKFSEVR